MTTEEALDLALEALEYIHEGANNQGPHTGISWRCVAVKAEPAIKAIKQARSAPVQEQIERAKQIWREDQQRIAELSAEIDRLTAAQQAPVQEPVAYRTWVDGWQYTEIPGDGEALCLCTHPAAQRQWVGLTDEERDGILDREFRQWWSRHDAVCRAIEAKLKEKNT